MLNVRSQHVIGKLYNAWYRKPRTEAAADRVREVAAKHGISGHAASLRWTAHHGALSAEHGDAIVIGASSIAQLNENLDIFEQGPLPQDVVDAVNAVAEEIGEDAIPYYF